MTRHLLAPSEKVALVADVGGTHLRIALATPGSARPELSEIRILRTPEGSLIPTLRDYMGAAAPRRDLSACAVAAAGRVRRLNGKARVSLTNVNLAVDIDELTSGIDAQANYLINDLAAVAAGVPLLGGGDYISFGPQRGVVPGMRLVIGIGTGFGVAAIGADDTLIESEAGHADLAAASAEERELLNRLSPLGRIAIESVLSGPGLAKLHAVISGQSPVSPDAVVSRALAEDPSARRAVTLFSTWIGRAVGNLILTFGAWGGVYLTGGVLEGLGSALDVQAFRAGIADKAPYGADAASVPVLWIRFPQPALLGLARLALEDAAPHHPSAAGV